ncbi:MAG: efflux RND transporter periplasmic adaptor subunit [Planctomycetaceae bacterium]
MRKDIVGSDQKMHSFIMNISLKHCPSFPVLSLALALASMTGCHKVEGNQPEPEHHAEHKILVTSPVARDVVRPQPFVCQIHSRRHIEVRALEGGYLEEILVKEGQVVKQGDVMFTILPTLYKAKLDSEKAEVQLAQIEFSNTEKLFQQKVVAQPEVSLAQAKLAKAQAQMKLAEAELNFATVKAPFDGIIDHQRHQQGSLIAEGDDLTTLSDNEVMWVYFNVPESDYLAYQASKDKDDLKIELVLANGNKFPHLGKIGAIEADFNNETGNIAFRADFPNPERLLRHGQTGTVLLSRTLKDAIVIPQRAKFEILAKNYVYVLEDAPPSNDASPASEGHTEPASPPPAHHPVPPTPAGHPAPPVPPSPEHAPHPGEAQAHSEPAKPRSIVRQREIEILGEMDDIYLIKSGLNPNDKIILEGIRQVRDGDKVEYEYVTPDEALRNLKYHAE